MTKTSDVALVQSQPVAVLPEIVTARFSDPTIQMPTATLRPVVRIKGTCRNETELDELPVSSGFFIDGWSQQLITAAHAVRPHRGMWLTELLVELRWEEDNQWVRACSVAYPKEWEQADVAVICLGASITRIDPSWRLGIVKDKEAFAATIQGHGAPFESVNVEAELSEPFLGLSKAGEPGMSGSPLTFKGSAVGVYKGIHAIDGKARPCATALREELLFELQERAFHRCREA